MALSRIIDVYIDPSTLRTWTLLLHKIFIRAHLKFTVYGRKQATKQATKQASKQPSNQATKQANIHMHVRVRNAVPLVWGSLRLAPIMSSQHLQDCYQDLDKIEPRLIHVSCTKKHARYLHGLVKIFLRTKKQWKNYVRNLHDSFLYLVRTCWNLNRIMNTPCMILVSFLCKNLTSSLTRILQTSCKDSCQDLGKDLY